MPLVDQRFALAFGVPGEEPQLILLAVEPLCDQPSFGAAGLRPPGDSDQVAVFVGQFAPLDIAAGGVDCAQPHLRVGLSGERVAVALDLRPLHSLMHNRVLGDVPRVDPCKCDAAAVAAPPVPAHLAEFFLRDVVRLPEGQAVFGFVGQALRCAALAVERVEVAVADE